MTMQEIIDDLFQRYMLMAVGTESQLKIARMLVSMRNKASYWPVDKLNRWLGYVQCLLIEVEGKTTTFDEREYTRGMFHSYYKEHGIEIPASTDIMEDHMI